VLSAAGLLAIASAGGLPAELRHTLMRLDTLVRFGWHRHSALGLRAAPWPKRPSPGGQRTGALIVLVRGASIAELIQGGTRLGAEVSRDLLVAIFQKASPLHDGAIVEATRWRAGAVLPLTQRSDVPEFYGSATAPPWAWRPFDALVIAVSEERGTVTLMQDASPGRLRARRLAELLGRLETEPRLERLARLRLAVASTSASSGRSGDRRGIWASRSITPEDGPHGYVPVVFSHVPAGMRITSQSSSDVDVQLSGHRHMARRRSPAWPQPGLSGPAGVRTLNFKARDLSFSGVRFESLAASVSCAGAAA